MADGIVKEDEDGNTKELKAHKFILALVSDVFRVEFYGGFQDNSSIDILDVKRESFQVMIDYIYNKGVDLETYDLGTEIAILPFAGPQMPGKN